FTVASHSSKIHMMKAGILKLLEFIAESESTVKVEHDNDKVQILKRKFSDINQTKSSPSKANKRDSNSEDSDESRS
ncbi:5525_t:CDS:2, partial [Paraglomus occultum]